MVNRTSPSTPTRPGIEPERLTRELFTDRQRRLVVELLHGLRPDWHPPGIDKALRRAEQDADSAAQLTAAAFTVAADPQWRTPDRIRQPGPHWPLIGRDAPTRLPTRLAAATGCPDHPGQRQPCRACAAEATAPPPELLATIRAQLRDRRHPDQVVAARAAEAMRGPRHESHVTV